MDLYFLRKDKQLPIEFGMGMLLIKYYAITARNQIKLS